MRIIDTLKEWTGVIQCCGLGFEEYGCGKTFAANTSDLRFDPKNPGVFFVVCPCGARNIVHVSEGLKDTITGTIRWCESSNGEYRCMAAKIDPAVNELPN